MQTILKYLIAFYAPMFASISFADITLSVPTTGSLVDPAVNPEFRVKYDCDFNMIKLHCFTKKAVIKNHCGSKIKNLSAAFLFYQAKNLALISTDKEHHKWVKQCQKWITASME